MNAKPLRLAFFGTPEFAVPALQKLLAGPHKVCCVITQPNRARGRGQKLSPSPVATCAQQHGLPLLQPHNCGDKTFLAALRQLEPDLGVVAAYGQFIPKTLRETPRLGYCINAHASLLPRWRGAAPVAHAIMAGDARTGISIMRVAQQMDAGAVARAFTQTTAIAAEENAGALTLRLQALAAHAVAAAVDAIAAGGVEWRRQDETRATLAPKITREDARLNFAQAAEELALRIRALAPKPGATTLLAGAPLRILSAAVQNESAPAAAAPGLVQHHGAGMRVATGRGWLVPLQVQRAGGRVMAAEEFLRGHALPEQTVLGAAP